jgi:hypothetical protein
MLEMKPREPKNRDKTRVKKKVETKGDKKPNQKGEKAIKEKEPKIKILAHELLAFTLSYLMLAP